MIFNGMEIAHIFPIKQDKYEENKICYRHSYLQQN